MRKIYEMDVHMERKAWQSKGEKYHPTLRLLRHHINFFLGLVSKVHGHWGSFAYVAVNLDVAHFWLWMVHREDCMEGGE